MSTSEFMQASPAQKAYVLLDGLSHLQTEVTRLKANVKVYNQWLGVYPDLVEGKHAMPMARKHFTIHFEELKKAYDALHEQFIILDLRTKTSKEAITYEKETV
jgi:hypothetical protein